VAQNVTVLTKQLRVVDCDIIQSKTTLSV